MKTRTALQLLQSRQALRRLLQASALGFATFLGLAQAGTTDLATAPLVTSSTSSVLPNVLFILDDSGSMYWDYMPDLVNDNFCKATSGSYNAPCCQDSNGNGTGSNSCWAQTTSSIAPFGTRRGHPTFLSGSYNGVMYNPSVTYTPPLKSDGSSWPSMTSANSSGWTSVKNDAYNIQNTKSTNLLADFPDMEWCTSTAYTDCLRNDNYILPGTVNGKSYTTFNATSASGSGTVATGDPAAPSTASRDFGPHYYAIIPGEYCDSPSLRNCQNTQSGQFIYPAYIRWCNVSTASTAASANPTASSTVCQATKTSSYRFIRYPTTYYIPGTAAVPATPEQPYIPPVAAVRATATFTLSLSGQCDNKNKVRINSVYVNGKQISLGTSSYEVDPAQLGNGLRSIINKNKGYDVTNSGATITLYAADTAGDINYSVAVYEKESGGKCNLSVNPTTPKFSGGVLANPGQPYIPANPGSPATSTVYPGSFVRVDIVPSKTNYALPGTAAKATTRTDCAGSTCTYAEEMTNYANWWTYYHTRMQMMKSSASISFGPIDERYRVGFMTINNAKGSDFINPAPFDTSQKSSWYSKLANANPSGGTPLRTALTKAGRLFAGAYNGSKINNVTVVDPMQYSCQQNFTILSTDGYWNDSNPGGYKIDGTSEIGDNDSTLARPLLDGNAQKNTLADVSAYYYATDLRTGSCTGAVVPPAATGNDVCANNVPVSGLDAAAHQHMTTFTVGLGASGNMQYSSSYTTATSGDYFDIKNGTTASSASGICTWQSSGICNWPSVTADDQSTIDDLWHTAVNGYGTYFSATNPAVLSSGLSSALAGVSARTGASSAATTSNPNIASGDNFLFSSTFTSVNWDGEMVRNQINLETGAVSTGNDWSAQAQLDAATPSSRVIYTYDPSGTNKLKAFTWSDLSGAEQAYFKTPNISTLSQFCTAGVTCLSSADQALAEGENLLNYLRGDRSNEGSATDPSTYFRQRAHVLGDIVNSEAVYTKTPQFNYGDSGYSSFKSSNSTRQGMVYVGANDGMVHAFNADTGAESWAYIPSMVMPNMFRTADKNYANLHRYSVDGTVVQGDVYDGSSWHTIIIGGLNGGGRGYYALDVTNPAEPKALWEFTYDTSKGSGYTKDANLGYTFGKPEITKLKDGTWVVLATSGYNNVSPGDGNGYLYVLNALTGAMVHSPIGTGAGNTGTPSGLGQVRAWAEYGDVNNLATRVYGGDMLGNVWRFDIDENIEPAGLEATLMATLKGKTGSAQPITAKPELGLVELAPVVYVGTGRYLGITDVTDTSPQTIYAIKDNLTTVSYGNPRTNSTFIEQIMTEAVCPANTPTSICTTGQTVRTSTSNPVNFTTDNGWFVDLIDAGERANNDPQLALGTLVFTTNVPAASACTIGGYSHIYFFDYATGGPVSTSTTGVTGTSLGNTLATRPVVAKLPNNKVIAITQLSDGSKSVKEIPVSGQPVPTRRVSWRELTSD